MLFRELVNMIEKGEGNGLTSRWQYHWLHASLLFNLDENGQQTFLPEELEGCFECSTSGLIMGNSVRSTGWE